MSMKECGSMIKQKDKEHILINREAANIPENGKTTNKVEWALNYGKMDLNIMENI